MPQKTALRPISSNPMVDAISETRRLLGDLNGRIVRQQRRIEKIILEQHGPRKEMEALLADMVAARDMMQDHISSFGQDRRSKTDDLWPPLDATSPSRG